MLGDGRQRERRCTGATIAVRYSEREFAFGGKTHRVGSETVARGAYLQQDPREAQQQFSASFGSGNPAQQQRLVPVGTCEAGTLSTVYQHEVTGLRVNIVWTYSRLHDELNRRVPPNRDLLMTALRRYAVH